MHRATSNLIMSGLSILSMIQIEIVRYIYSLWFVFGMVGCLLNLIVFSRPQLRKTSCCICKYSPAFQSFFLNTFHFAFHRFLRGLTRSSFYIDHRYCSGPIQSRSSRSATELSLVLQTARLSLSNQSDALEMVRGRSVYRSIRPYVWRSAFPEFRNAENEFPSDRHRHRLLVNNLYAPTDFLRNRDESLRHSE